MTRIDLILLWIITIAAFVLVVMRIRLARAQGHPQKLGWTLQQMIFPVALLIALLLYHWKQIQVIAPVVLLALLEELICSGIRRNAQKRQQSQGPDQQ